MIAALCLGGGVVGYLIYDRATAPDRSAPDVVVDNYLRAFLVDRNDVRADLFTCEGNPALDAAEALREEILRRESEFGVVVRVSWGPLHQTKTGQGQSVATTLTISSSADGEPRSSRREDWIFQVVDEADGWRVCGGSSVPR
ncbi:hypothetical protein Xph01_24680 [Micromonospora phaseoli]|nr:hypothetical protein Xph01_24680 [Micromonospora phaseoli]